MAFAIWQKIPEHLIERPHLEVILHMSGLLVCDYYGYSIRIGTAETDAPQKEYFKVSIWDKSTAIHETQFGVFNSGFTMFKWAITCIDKVLIKNMPTVVRPTAIERWLS